MAEVLKCPSCGASLDSDGSRAVVRCEFCGNRVQIGEIAPPCADLPPAYSPALPRQAEEPSVVQRRVQALFQFVGAISAGFLACESLWAFRTPYSEPLPIELGVGATALVLAVVGNRLLAAVLAGAAGALMTLKPWAVPIPAGGGRYYSPNSETAYFFLIPGLLLLGVSLAIALTIRREHLSGLKHLKRKGIVFFILFAFGVTLGILDTTGTTRRELYQARAKEFLELRVKLRRLAETLAADPRLPETATGLNPPPTMNSRWTGNMVVLPFESLQKPDVEPANRLYLEGRLLHIMLKTTGGNDYEQHYDYRFADEEDRRDIDATLALRYLAVYQAQRQPPAPGSPPSQDPWSDGLRLTVWLLDIPSGKPLLKFTLPEIYHSFLDCRRELLNRLAAATGGTFSVD